ncbi:hypothetical protein RchiOBHm_Chr3g0478711 [Rosa chinensis]|uniref:Uncharacterized protein n=1 Tax=Rosa chinensis TaxID=74649 RepID=A0A2P6RD73_ROSCH|nr:hypothetical protein RchiOBHm_Chr3g0478711 [Rosa chinensis]
MKVSPFSYYVLIFSIGFRLFLLSSQISLPSLLLKTIGFYRKRSLKRIQNPIEIDLARGFKTQFCRSSATRPKPKAKHRSISQEDSKPNSVAPPQHAPNPKHSRIDLSVSSKPSSSSMVFGT